MPRDESQAGSSSAKVGPARRKILTSRQIDHPHTAAVPRRLQAARHWSSPWCCRQRLINDPDVAGINGASVALSVSDIPCSTARIGAVRVELVDGNFVINPTYDEQRAKRLNLMVVGTADSIVMIESGAKEVSEKRPLSRSIEFGHQESRRFAPRYQRPGAEGRQGQAQG